MKRSTFNITLQLALNKITGEEFLFRTAKDLEDDITVAVAEFDHKHSERNTTDEDRAAIAKARYELVETLKSFRDRTLTLAQALKKDSTFYEFTLAKPSFGEDAQAFAKANVGGHWNEMTYRKLLLENGGVIQNGKVLNAKEIDELPSLVGRELGRRLVQALFNDQTRVVLALPTGFCMQA